MAITPPTANQMFIDNVITYKLVVMLKLCCDTKIDFIFCSKRDRERIHRLWCVSFKARLQRRTVKWQRVKQSVCVYWEGQMVF